MQLIFTKKNGKYDHLSIVKGGQEVGNIDCPKQGIIPHDMVHYGVENTLHKRGFISRIHAGEKATLQMQAEAESDGVERLVEVFQADGWSGWQTPAEDMLELYQVTCDARHCPALQVKPEDVESVRCELLRLSSLWSAVAIGDSLTLGFDLQA